MTTLLKGLSALAFLLCLSLQAKAFTSNVDLRDVIRFGSAQDQQQAQALIAQINQAPTKFGLPQTMVYSLQTLSAIGQPGVSTIEIQNGTATGYDVFLIYIIEKEMWLNRVRIDYRDNSFVVTKTDLTRNPLSAQIDIFNRQMAVYDQRSGFLKYEPVSLGSLINNRLGDPNSGFKSLSVAIARGVLSRSKSEVSRTEPDYYRGRPFLRILDLDQEAYDGFTPFGLHYQISDVFQRGFVSNGCFRLRDTDLYELATMVFNSKRSGVPISIVNSTAAGNRHPYPLINDWYNSPRVIVNAKGKFELMTIEHGLYQFDKQIGQPELLLGGRR